jgi:hypothetical protein
MPEAEVALRLAFHLLSLPMSDGTVSVCIDGAQVKVHGGEVFPITLFLRHHGWEQALQVGKNRWQGIYKRNGQTLELMAKSGIGDVVATIGEKRVRAECKQGPLVKKPGSPEYPNLREAIGQAMTVETVGVDDIMVVAVPHTEYFARLVGLWQQRALIRRSGIQLMMVGRDDEILGLRL